MITILITWGLIYLILELFFESNPDFHSILSLFLGVLIGSVIACNIPSKSKLKVENKALYLNEGTNVKYLLTQRGCYILTIEDESGLKEISVPSEIVTKHIIKGNCSKIISKKKIYERDFWNNWVLFKVDSYKKCDIYIPENTTELRKL